MEPDELDSRELARTRCRDQDAAAEERDLMRPGMGKVFKQILDHQGREARETREATPPRPGRPRDGSRAGRTKRR
jgi:hypothetical protein